MERTLAIIKPDAVRRGLSGDIIKRIEASGLQIVGLRKLQLSSVDAGAFYEVHKQRPFFESLCKYMTSGPVIVAVLQGENAITRWRQLMGATDPKKADAAKGNSVACQCVNARIRSGRSGSRCCSGRAGSGRAHRCAAGGGELTRLRPGRGQSWHAQGEGERS